MNVLFCSFYMIEDKEDTSTFLLYSNFCLQFEKEFSVFQLVKILCFMGLQYEHLYVDDPNVEVVSLVGKAGSGKTFVVSRRTMRLLSENKRVLILYRTKTLKTYIESYYYIR